MSLTSDDLADIKQLLLAMENRFDRRFDEIDKRFDEVDKRFDEVYERFDEIDKRFDEVYERFDENDEKLNEIMNAIGSEFQEKAEQIDTCTTQLTDHETRILRLESQAA